MRIGPREFEEVLCPDCRDKGGWDKKGNFIPFRKGGKIIMAKKKYSLEAGTDVVVTAKSKWYTSKTLWTNTIGLAALAIQMQFGFIVPAAYQAAGLTVINFLLRIITKTELVA